MKGEANDAIIPGAILIGLYAIYRDLWRTMPELRTPEGFLIGAFAATAVAYWMDRRKQKRTIKDLKEQEQAKEESH